ncbi:MAG TPA: hypothetical protein ENH41_04980 [Candidatus Omnitrophica bacterium]|nr:hypothetical protein [Candidatus Omnitrophota bacterium]
MKNCQFKKETLIGYCYNELAPDEAKQVKDHLGVCKNCELEVSRLKETIAFFKQHKLKEPPRGLLDGYTQKIKEAIVEGEEKSGIFSGLDKKLAVFMNNLRLAFYPRLIPVAVTICIVAFIFLVTRGERAEHLNTISQEIALFDELSGDVAELLMLSDENNLVEELNNSDRIFLAQLEENTETEVEDMLYELELLQELGELDEGGDYLEDELDLLDEVEVG